MFRKYWRVTEIDSLTEITKRAFSLDGYVVIDFKSGLILMRLPLKVKSCDCAVPVTPEEKEDTLDDTLTCKKTIVNNTETNEKIEVYGRKPGSV